MSLDDVLQQLPIFVYLSTFIFGLIIGSFLNVVIFRLPKMLIHDWSNDCINFLGEQDNKFSYKKIESDGVFNLAVPGSACPHCQHKISAFENIPLFSYLFLKGRCSECGTAISLRYPFIELLTGIISFMVVWHFGLTWQALYALFLSWNLIALSGIDFDHQYLPDSITLPLIWLGLLLNSFNTFVDLHSAVIGAIIGYLSLWCVFHLFKLLTKKEGMGYGDFKLLALFGAWFGWQSLAAIIMLSSIAGAIIGISLIVIKNQTLSKKIPFGPYLAIAGWIFMMYGNNLNNWYLHYVGLQ